MNPYPAAIAMVLGLALVLTAPGDAPRGHFGKLTRVRLAELGRWMFVVGLAWLLYFAGVVAHASRTHGAAMGAAGTW